jgi:Flp pilus assembly pilin Flp
MLRLNKRGQSTAEYAMIFGVVIGALIAVGTFIRSGIEAKLRDMTNQYVNQDTDASALQTSTGFVQSDYTTTQVSRTDTTQTSGSSGTTSTVGGGDETSADTQGYSERSGVTTLFATGG